MLGLDSTHALRAAAGILVAAALVGPDTGLSQSEPDPPDENAELLARIDELSQQRASGLAQADELIDALTALGIRYAESEVLVLAADALGRALDVTRQNYGLYSLEQAPVMRQLIGVEEARGNSKSAWDLEQELLLLTRRHPEDLRTVPILRETAQKRIDLMERFIGGELPPQIFYGCYFALRRINPNMCTSGSKGRAVGAVFTEAWGYYKDAIDVILRSQSPSSSELRESELREIETELLRANYLYGDYLDAPLRYEQGKERLERLLDYAVASSEPLATQMELRAEVADWELLYSNNGAALNIYHEVYEQLMAEGVAREAIDRIFLPESPVVIPSFLPNPLVSDDTPESTGYIDVGFEITRFGEGRKIDILDTSANASKASRQHVVRLITLSKFRPRMVDGEFARASPVQVRYFLNE